LTAVLAVGSARNDDARKVMATNVSNNYGTRDNHSRGKVADFLVEKIADSSQLSVVSAYFTG